MTLFNTPRFQGSDDIALVKERKDYSGGENNRVHPQSIKEIQASILYNVDIGTPGKCRKRDGLEIIANDVSDSAPKALCNFIVTGANDQLLMIEGTNLRSWVGTGDWSAALKSDFTDTTYSSMLLCKESGLTPDDIVIIQNGTDNAFRVDAAGNMQDLGDTVGTGTDSPPTSLVMCWYNNRVWILKNDLLYFSSSYPADYSIAFDTASNAFRVPVGEEIALIPTRDMGIIVIGKQAIWALAPSLTPDPSTDQPEPIDSSRGCIARNSVVVVGDDIYYLANDGVRSLRRTIQDKLQSTTSLPLSFALKDEQDDITWDYIDKACAVYFDNKYFISLPSGGTIYNSKVWVFYPGLNEGMGAWIVITGWTISCFAKYKVGGQERLYAGEANANGVVYRAWYGKDDNGVAIDYRAEGREEDMSYPTQDKIGGFVEVEAISSGNYDITILASINGEEYTELGSINLVGEAPTLPVSLPFTLASANTIRKKFPLWKLGFWRTLKIKEEHNDTNAGDDIIIIGYKIVTYLKEVQDA